MTSSVNLEQPFPLERNPFAVDAKPTEIFRVGEVQMSRVVLKTRSSRRLKPPIPRRVLRTHHRRLAPSTRSSLRFPQVFPTRARRQRPDHPPQDQHASHRNQEGRDNPTHARFRHH